MRGRATLRQALTFISKHSAEPEIYTSAKIADEYKLKPSVVGMYTIRWNFDSHNIVIDIVFYLFLETDSILKHFQTFEVYIPENKGEDKILTKDRLKQLWHNEPKPLPPPKYTADEHFDLLRKQHVENQQKKEEEKRKMNQQKLE